MPTKKAKEKAKAKAAEKAAAQSTVKDVGRPTDYTDDMPAQLLAYFDIEPGRWTIAENQKGEERTVWVANPFPTLAGFARLVGHDRGTLAAWAEAHPDFSRAYKLAKECQEDVLLQNGLLGGYDSSFARFTAKNVIGYRDRHEVDTDPPPVKPDAMDLADAALKVL